MSFSDPDPTGAYRRVEYDVPGSGQPSASSPWAPAEAPSGAANERPAAVTIGALAVVLNLCLYVISFALVVANHEALVTSAESTVKGQPGIEQIDIKAVAQFVLVGGAVCQLVISAVFAALAVGALRRRNGARIACDILAWVLLVTQIVSFASAAGQVAPASIAAVSTITTALTGISMLLLATTGVTLVLPASSHWFRTRGR